MDCFYSVTLPATTTSYNYQLVGTSTNIMGWTGQFVTIRPTEVITPSLLLNFLSFIYFIGGK